MKDFSLGYHYTQVGHIIKFMKHGSYLPVADRKILHKEEEKFQITQIKEWNFINFVNLTESHLSNDIL